MDSGWQAHFAKILQLPRSSIYTKPVTRSANNSVLVTELRKAHEQHKLYGVRRLALHLKWGKNKTRRVMRIAEIKATNPAKKRSKSKSNQPEVKAPINALKAFGVFRDADRPQKGLSYAKMVDSGGWVQDFTYLYILGKWYYLALVLDLRARRILGWCLDDNHSSELTYKALVIALSDHDPPTILHSDQGSEYLSFKHKKLCEDLGIVFSCSDKASPWQNGFMERFMSSLKAELKVRGFNSKQTPEQLYEMVAGSIHYYNYERIHTALRMSPNNYASLNPQETFKPIQPIELELSLKERPTADSRLTPRIDMVLQKAGA